jgi:hypothetical protein
LAPKARCGSALPTLMMVTAVLAVEIGWLMVDP